VAYPVTVPVGRTNGVKVLSPSEVKNVIRALTLYQEEKYIRMISLAEEQIISGCCPCLKKKR